MGQQSAPLSAHVPVPLRDRSVSGVDEHRGEGLRILRAMSRLGIIGVGQMGAQIWHRIDEQAGGAIVADADPSAVAALAAHGAHIAPGPSDLAAKCTTILLSLPTSTEVEEVTLGPGGVATSAAPGTIVVDLTSGVPSSSRRIAAALGSSGIHYVDCGVSGGVAGARAGTLKAMVGATRADFEAVEPVLDLIATQVWHCGDVGAGHLVKTLLNQANQSKLMVELEALLVAAKAGLDPELVGEVLGTGVWNQWLFGPTARQPVGFALSLACKDFDIALRVAAEEQVGIPLAAAAQQTLRLASGAAGPDADLIESVAVWERIARTAIAPRARGPHGNP
jgi:3-hydroxyisobutyrate dehydrogenase